MTTATNKAVFHASQASRLPTARTIFIQGRLAAGKVNTGLVLQFRDKPEKQIRVKSVALVNFAEPSSEFTLSIEEPAFPLSELEGADLIEAA